MSVMFSHSTPDFFLKKDKDFILKGNSKEVTTLLPSGSTNPRGQFKAQHKAGDTPGDFIRRSRRILSPACDFRCDFRHRLMRTHLVIFFADRGDVAVLKTHEIKSPNLMGWLYWQFAAINVENRGNGHTWRMQTNLMANNGHASYRRFYTPIAAIGENRNLSTGHTWRFSPIAAIGV